jgi:hypothetical protein
MLIGLRPQFQKFLNDATVAILKIQMELSYFSLSLYVL